jgi:hypothetical protein
LATLPRTMPVDAIPERRALTRLHGDAFVRLGRDSGHRLG